MEREVESTPLKAQGLRAGRCDSLEENESSAARRSRNECWEAKQEVHHMNRGRCIVQRKI